MEHSFNKTKLSKTNRNTKEKGKFNIPKFESSSFDSSFTEKSMQETKKK